MIQKTDQEDNINLGKVAFDDNNQERKSWACLGQTCSRSLIVFLSKLFVNLLIIFSCLWRIHLSKTFISLVRPSETGKLQLI